MNIFKNMSLFTKILALGITIVIAFTLVLTWMFTKFRTDAYDAKSVKTQHLVEAAWGVLDHFDKQAKAGVLTEENAKKAAMATIRNMRYDREEYFWINDLEPRMIMHPFTPELEGQRIGDRQDPTGKRLFTEMVEVCRSNGEGFVNYMWPKPGQTEPFPKISFVKLFSAWGWIVGSGIYIDDVEREVWRILLTVLIIGILLLVGNLTLSIFLARSISNPISTIVHQLTNGAEHTASAANQVSSAAQQLSQGATEQAASLEETSSSLAEMNAMATQNTDNASKANQLAQEARQSAEQGSQAISEMQTAMQAISEASDKISKIIKTIEEIALQTNLLALNTAVEAARVGEHGKGFAVVADEVRNLAQRAADSAKDTAVLISDTISKVKHGSEMTKKSEKVLKGIITNANNVADIIAEIAAASKEQAEGLAQVAKAFTQVDQVTQGTAASAEESASSAEELTSQAEGLRCMVVELQKVVAGANYQVASSTPDYTSEQRS